MGLIGAQLCLALGDVLLPRADHRQIEALFRDYELRLRRVQSGFGAFKVLLADGSAGGEGCQRRQSVPTAAGVDLVRLADATLAWACAISSGRLP